MKRLLYAIAAVCLCITLSACQNEPNIQVATTTSTVYEFTARICDGTDICVGQIITENVSCLHDYTLQTSQMRMLEKAQILVISGAGLEDFLFDVVPNSNTVIDASESIELVCAESSHSHSHDSQDHNEHDPHIWLSPANAKQMATNICIGLEKAYPQHTERFHRNLELLLEDLSALEEYGSQQLKSLSNRKLITFHDGFAYLAKAFDLEILKAIEEESGSEASAAELIEICQLIYDHDLPAIFTELNGSVSASEIISSETDTSVYQLDMAMSGNGYLNAMYHNIDTLKEALE